MNLRKAKSPLMGFFVVLKFNYIRQCMPMMKFLERLLLSLSW